MAKYYPAFIDVSNRICIVIGGGDIGRDKVEKLIDCGAAVRVISAQPESWLSQLVRDDQIEWVKRKYQPGDLKDAFIAILVDTSEQNINAKVSDEASERNVLLNVVDVTHLCTFIAPSVANRGEITIATSTGGTSPALARTFREKIEAECPCRLLEFADLAPLLSWARGVVKENNWLINPSYWQECINEELLDMVQSGSQDLARERLISLLEKGVQPR
ncbi:MAG: bifunctional precorrin-2 dehydrogenase/sirohydrochlorin ferrochelatase [Chloroflexota bacterium]|uniref:precorrin-2 dehydrogenase n=1 Tax=marine metagenome TaxID=408172 RepID=A0A382AHW4_9ZZZZ|nr:bifunctional precorrin-2 dehydrogenase/sirohydrochlorin ferrochelatase [Chloroflexota bacterium]